ncbi:hypothetical protein HBA92_21845 [Ochrobactrum sp. MR28]|nr:hypothetical protein [Ochrobactrum sp. MR28]MBX8818970.1 hypothetical protein [Ochrobactrum sp. MR31]
MTHPAHAATADDAHSEYYIIWNENRSEGFVTDDYSDATQVFEGNFQNGHTSLGFAFHESYGEGSKHFETVNPAAAQADFERRILSNVVTKPVDVAAVRIPVPENSASEKWPPLKKALWHVLMEEKLNDGHYIKAFEFIEKLYSAAIRAISTEPAQGVFDDADWFYRDIDPDDSGDTAYEAIVNQPAYSVHLVHSSFRGESRFVFRAPTLNQDDDEDETLNFATEEEAITASIARKEAIEALPAAPTTEAGK